MKRKLFIVTIFILLILTLLIINGIYCNNTLEISNYSFKTDELKTSLRIVFISDQHNKEFGENNANLVSKIKEQKPDIIMVGGDMVTRNFSNDGVMKNLFPQLAAIAPTYCCLGNHERDLANEIDFSCDIAQTGVKLLDNESINFKKNGESILIGGLSDFPYYDFDAPNYDTPERYFWDEFKEDSAKSFSILLHHQPEYIGDMISESNVDIVLCGHTHGGLARIPFVGGVFAPNQGFFPKYDKGEFEFGNSKMIVSSGLGNSNPLPRINNCAEIVVIDVN